MGHYGALWGVFKRDISESIQAYPIVPHNAPIVRSRQHDDGTYMAILSNEKK